jgi:hypothetical protein
MGNGKKKTNKHAGNGKKIKKNMWGNILEY